MTKQELIKSFYDKTGCPMVCNTSFNVRGEPIVLSPQDAYECFMSNEMDVLILENYVILKKDQINRNYDFNKKNKFILD
jgi:carbamoyltransferase